MPFTLVEEEVPKGRFVPLDDIAPQPIAPSSPAVDQAQQDQFLRSLEAQPPTPDFSQPPPSVLPKMQASPPDMYAPPGMGIPQPVMEPSAARAAQIVSQPDPSALRAAEIVNARPYRPVVDTLKEFPGAVSDTVRGAVGAVGGVLRSGVDSFREPAAHPDAPVVPGSPADTSAGVADSPADIPGSGLDVNAPPRMAYEAPKPDRPTFGDAVDNLQAMGSNVLQAGKDAVDRGLMALEGAENKARYGGSRKDQLASAYDANDKALFNQILGSMAPEEQAQTVSHYARDERALNLVEKLPAFMVAGKVIPAEAFGPIGNALKDRFPNLSQRLIDATVRGLHTGTTLATVGAVGGIDEGVEGVAKGAAGGFVLGAGLGAGTKIPGLDIAAFTTFNLLEGMSPAEAVGTALAEVALFRASGMNPKEQMKKIKLKWSQLRAGKAVELSGRASTAAEGGRMVNVGGKMVPASEVKNNPKLRQQYAREQMESAFGREYADALFGRQEGRAPAKPARPTFALDPSKPLATEAGGRPAGPSLPVAVRPPEGGTTSGRPVPNLGNIGDQVAQALEQPAASIQHKEMLVQAEVLRTLSGGDEAVVMQLIDRVSPEMRNILSDFEKEKGRVPTADEIIWIMGEHHKSDPRYVDNLLNETFGESAVQKVKDAIVQQEATTQEAPKNTEDRWQKLLDRAKMEADGEGYLDDIIDQKLSPIEIEREFWNKTYPAMTPDMQLKFRKMAAAMVGENESNIIEWINREGAILDSNDAEFLQGPERGHAVRMYVMNEARESFDGESKQRAIPPSAPTQEAGKLTTAQKEERTLAEAKAKEWAEQELAKLEAATPAEAVAVVKDEMTNPDNRRPAKEIRADIIDQLEKAIADAPETRFEKLKELNEKGEAAMREAGADKWDDAPTRVEFEIPGDGSFRILNTKEQLEKVLTRAKRLTSNAADPSDGGKATYGKNPPMSRDELVGAMVSSQNAIRDYRTQIENGVYTEKDVETIERAIADAEQLIKDNGGKLIADVTAHKQDLAQVSQDAEAARSKRENARRTVQATADMKLHPQYKEIKNALFKHGDTVPDDGNILDVIPQGKGAPEIRKMQDALAKDMGLHRDRYESGRYGKQKATDKGAFDLSKYWNRAEFAKQKAPDVGPIKDATPKDSGAFTLGETTVVERTYGLDATVYKWPGRDVLLRDMPDKAIQVYKTKSGWLINDNGKTFGKSRKGVGSNGFESQREAIENYIAESKPAEPAMPTEEAADKATEDYWMGHRPNKEGPQAFDLLSTDLAPRDIYDRPDLYTGEPSGVGFKESVVALKKIRGNPDAEVTVYRASPKNTLNSGDWISFSRAYSEQHGMADSPADDVPVHSFKVKAKDVRWAGDTLEEFGYYPEKPSAPQEAPAQEAQTGTPITVEAWHGSKRTHDGRLSLKYGGESSGDITKYGFTFSDKKTATEYKQGLEDEALVKMWGAEEAGKIINRGTLLHGNIRMQNPLVVDMSGYDYKSKHYKAEDGSTRSSAMLEHRQQMIDGGHDGIVFKNVHDTFDRRPVTVYFIPNAESFSPISKEAPTQEAPAPQTAQDIGKEAQRAKTGGYVTIPERAGLKRVTAQLGRSIRANFTRMRGMDANTYATILERNHAKESALIASQETSASLKAARKVLTAKFGREKVQQAMQDVIYGTITIDEFRDQFDVGANSPAVIALKKFHAARTANSLEISKLLEERGAPPELVEKIADNDFYMSRIYMKHLMGDSFVPKAEDYDAAAMVIKAGIDDALIALSERANEMTGQRASTAADVVGYMQTRNPALIQHLSKSRQNNMRILADKFSKLKQVIDSAVYDENGNVIISENADAVLDAARSTVDYYLNREQPGAGHIDTSHLKQRFLEGAFRKLYQEVTDPMFAPAMTIEAQETLIAEMTMFNKMISTGEGTLWTSMPSEKLGTIAKLGSEDSGPDKLRYGKLAGKFVTKELRTALIGSDKPGFLRSNLWYKPMGVMRGLKLLGPKTIARNYVEAYVGFAVGSGDAMRKGYGKNYTKSSALQAGIVAKNPASLETLRGLVKSGVFSMHGSSQAEEVSRLFSSNPKAVMSAGFKKTMELYSLIDFPTKVAAYWTALDRGMTEAEAVEHVRQFYQNPESLPKVMPIISKLGVADYTGYFVDALRIRGNQVKHAVKSAKKGDLVPMVGLTTSTAADMARRGAILTAWKVGLVGAWAAIQAMLRGDDKDDTEKAELVEKGREAALRQFMPPWYQVDPLLTWEETRRDGTKAVYYSSLGGNSAFNTEDLLYGAFQSEESLAGIPGAVLKNLFLDRMRPGMYPAALYKFATGDAITGDFKSMGIQDVIAGTHPQKAGIIMQSMLNLGLDIYGGQIGPKISQTMAIKQKQAGDAEIKAGTYTSYRDVKEVWTSLANPVRTYGVDKNQATILLRNKMFDLRDAISEAKGMVSRREKAIKAMGKSTEYLDKGADLGQASRMKYLNEAAGIVANARVAFGGMLSEDEIDAVLRDGLNVSREEAYYIMEGTVEKVEKYAPSPRDTAIERLDGRVRPTRPERQSRPMR